ncbi:mfs transporter [Diplodia corticola]|uniref:Mfs transporter n=1 Tax=Diplodia corticola TaxID=236234 RepID=A0A1J9R450_9PEZI|nr:mfs transporter [Diplodia corticola]OJD35361.1 mfs transporter [Diplodia corticola]
MAINDVEKVSRSTTAHELRECEATPAEPEPGSGDIKVLADSSLSGNVKTTADGNIVLIPQPSADPDDPLNWSWKKKHFVFTALMLPSFLSDFSVTYGAVIFEKQAQTWDMSVAAVSNSIGGALFMLGPGGVLAVPMTERFGRLPVLFWSQLAGLVLTIGATLSTTYTGFTAVRVLQGLFTSPPQVIGLTFIHDMFFFHERTRKINIWCVAFLVGPIFAPVMSSLILSKVGWREDFAVVAGMYFLSLLLVIVMGDETAFDRRNTGNNIKSCGIRGRLELLTGVAGWKTKGRPSLRSVFVQIFQVQIKPQMLLPATGFYMVLVMWTIGFVTTLSQILYPAPYFFTPAQVGLFYLAPCIGSVVGELYGHWFNDWLCTRYIRKHNGKYRPENRLWSCYPGLVLGVAGLVIYGQALQHQLSWVVLAVGYGVYAVAQMAVPVAIIAYLLDVFPDHSVITSAIINFWRTTGGFCVGYFELKWIARTGAGATFGTQAALLVASFLTIIAVQIWGKEWRAKYPAPSVG